MIAIILFGVGAFAMIVVMVTYEISKWKLERAAKKLHNTMRSIADDFATMNRNLNRLIEERIEKNKEDPDDPYINKIEDLDE